MTDPLGGILLANCGFINTNVFIDSVRELVEKNQYYVEEELDEKKMEIEKEGIYYRELSAQKIIFCTGIHQLNSNLFEGLPLKPLKGEVITINNGVALNRIYNRGVYVIESGNMEYKVGATYNLENPVGGVTDAGREELIQKVSDFLKIQFKITHQDWGIRPSTIDRRPLLGVHPQYENVVIFNGLGTKGVSLAPYFSDQLTKWLLDGAKLDSQVNISRVKALYSKFD